MSSKILCCNVMSKKLVELYSCAQNVQSGSLEGSTFINTNYR